MAEAHVDQDMRGEVVRWYRSDEAYESQQTSVEPCPHSECRHMGCEVVGWGGDYRHYEIVRCSDCRCRGWWSEQWLGRGSWGWQVTALRADA